MNVRVALRKCKLKMAQRIVTVDSHLRGRTVACAAEQIVFDALLLNNEYANAPCDARRKSDRTHNAATSNVHGLKPIGIRTWTERFYTRLRIFVYRRNMEIGRNLCCNTNQTTRHWTPDGVNKSLLLDAHYGIWSQTIWRQLRGFAERKTPSEYSSEPGQDASTA